MRRVVAITLILIFCLAGCRGNTEDTISKEQESSSNQSSQSSIVSTEEDSISKEQGYSDQSSQSSIAAAEEDPIQLLKNIRLNDWGYDTEIRVTDINGDHLPEIMMVGGGTDFRVYYYSGGSVQQVGDLFAWIWSCDLLTVSNGDVVLYTKSHSDGTAGLLQYRVYRWDGVKYSLFADLWRIPAQWNEENVPVSYYYLQGNTVIDIEDLIEADLWCPPSRWEEHGCPIAIKAETLESVDWCKQITQEEFDKTIVSLGSLTSFWQNSKRCPSGSDEEIMEFIRVELDAWQ